MKIHDISEKELRAARFLLGITGGIPHSGGSFFGHLYNTFYLLKEMGATEDACLAGMYHSVYGTEIMQYSLGISRETVIDMIGETAEQYVQFYTVKDRYNSFANNTLGLDLHTQICMLKILYANDKEQNNNGIGSMKYMEYMRLLKELITSLEAKLSNYS